MQTKFYKFTQNNSGGYFDVDENVCHRVIIEANDSDHAERIFEPMIENQSSSCSCCGERWSGYSPDEIDLSEWKTKGYSVSVSKHYKDAEERWIKLYGEFPRMEEPTWIETEWGWREYTGKIFFNTIEEYCQYLANDSGWTIPDARIHFLDGTKKEIFAPEK